MKRFITFSLCLAALSAQTAFGEPTRFEKFKTAVSNCVNKVGTAIADHKKGILYTVVAASAYIALGIMPDGSLATLKTMLIDKILALDSTRERYVILPKIPQRSDSIVKRALKVLRPNPESQCGELANACLKSNSYIWNSNPHGFTWKNVPGIGMVRPFVKTKKHLVYENF